MVIFGKRVQTRFENVNFIVRKKQVQRGRFNPLYNPENTPFYNAAK
jgi:hypothetical protein